MHAGVFTLTLCTLQSVQNSQNHYSINPIYYQKDIAIDNHLVL